MADRENNPARRRAPALPPPAADIDGLVAFDPDYLPFQRLGAGRCGTVLRAVKRSEADTPGSAAVDYAVKILRPLPAAEKHWREEFRTAREADHPALARVFSLELRAATPYLLMEYVHGVDLEAWRLRGGGRLAPAAVEKLARPLWGALREFHRARRGRPHLGLDPGRFLVDDAGAAKLIDFGASTAWARENPASESAAVRPGTAACRAPELSDNQPGDARADIYALGALIHRLLTGLWPAEAEGGRRSRGKPLPEAEGELWKPFFSGCLAPDPARRFDNAEAAGLALPAMSEPAAPPADAPADETRRREMQARWLRLAAKKERIGEPAEAERLRVRIKDLALHPGTNLAGTPGYGAGGAGG